MKKAIAKEWLKASYIVFDKVCDILDIDKSEINS